MRGKIPSRRGGYASPGLFWLGWVDITKVRMYEERHSWYDEAMLREQHRAVQRRVLYCIIASCKYGAGRS